MPTIKPLFLSTKILAQEGETVTSFRILTDTLKATLKPLLAKSQKTILYFDEAYPISAHLLNEVASVSTADLLQIEIEAKGLCIEHYLSKPHCRQFVKWVDRPASNVPGFLVDFFSPTTKAQPESAWLKKATLKLKASRYHDDSDYVRQFAYGEIAGDGYRLHADLNLEPAFPPELVDADFDKQTLKSWKTAGDRFAMNWRTLLKEHQNDPVLAQALPKTFTQAVKIASSRNKEMIQVVVKASSCQLIAVSQEFGDLETGLDFETTFRQDYSFFINPKFLLDALSGMTGKKALVNIRYAERPGEAGIIILDDGQGHWSLISCMNPPK